MWIGVCHGCTVDGGELSTPPNRETKYSDASVDRMSISHALEDTQKPSSLAPVARSRPRTCFDGRRQLFIKHFVMRPGARGSMCRLLA
jgi:hypothetical protein